MSRQGVFIREEFFMPRLPYPDPAKLAAPVRAAVEGQTLNVTRMLAGASTDVFMGFTKFAGAFYTGSKLDPVLREVAILRAGYLCNSRYETYQHEAAARMLKMTEAQIAALKKGGPHPGVLNETEQAVMDFTDDVVKNVRAGDETLGRVRKLLGEQLVLDLILVIGLYMTVSRVLETTGVELDVAPLDWTDMHKAAPPR
jgi:alkylhydroperoxidase family enzyme